MSNKLYGSLYRKQNKWKIRNFLGKYNIITYQKFVQNANLNNKNARFYIIYQEMPINFKEVIDNSVKSGTAGATAMFIQVMSLMWMRTTMNYQFKNGGSFLQTLRKLYAQGGVLRFYRGVIPALIIGPIARFGDTAANMLSRNIFQQQNMKGVPIFVQTSLGSVLAGTWRLSTLPVDAWKTSKQVHGENGLKIVIDKYKSHGIKAFYQGGVASATATMVGHYPWFVTNNYLDYYMPKYSFKDQKLKALLRGAIIGFICTMVSDTVSNSIRVLKTIKQTSQNHITYSQAFNDVVAKQGYTGLLFRGLKTKLLTNGVQGVIFSVAWRFFQEKLQTKNLNKA